MNQPPRIIRAREVSRRTGLSLSTLWRLGQRDPEFPAKVRLNEDGSAVGFYEHEIDAWIRNRIRGVGRLVRRLAAELHEHAEAPAPAMRGERRARQLLWADRTSRDDFPVVADSSAATHSPTKITKTPPAGRRPPKTVRIARSRIAPKRHRP